MLDITMVNTSDWRNLLASADIRSSDGLVCTICGVPRSDHDLEHLASECYPHEFRVLRAALRSVLGQLMQIAPLLDGSEADGMVDRYTRVMNDLRDVLWLCGGSSPRLDENLATLIDQVQSLYGD